MTASFSTEEILAITGGELIAGSISLDHTASVCTDTRTVKIGQWYVALSGENFDGHKFLAQAANAGAIGAIVDLSYQPPASGHNFPTIAVRSPLKAYQDLAHHWRCKINPKVIAVTGSSGKTTTKEMCASVVSARFRTHKSRENQNNEVGVAHTFISMPADTEVVVVELGMRGIGQIKELASIAKPDISVITNTGVAHLELLGSIENIAMAKCEVLTEMDPDNGIAILGQRSYPLLPTARGTYPGRILACSEDYLQIIATDKTHTVFRGPGESREFAVRAHGRKLIIDAWCAVHAGRAVGMTDDQICAGLGTFSLPDGRGNHVIASNGSLIIDQSYNGNPDSVRAAVEGMFDSEAYPYGKKIVVLGPMAELGPSAEQLHFELGVWLRDKPFSMLITVGPMAANIAAGAAEGKQDIVCCSDRNEALTRLWKETDTNTCVFIKASHSANLTEIVNDMAAMHVSLPA
jgi:UDP-N-acetylmuramoyl-tripeptide--D-alanyl-D-alanine ligase